MSPAGFYLIGAAPSIQGQRQTGGARGTRRGRYTTSLIFPVLTS